MPNDAVMYAAEDNLLSRIKAQYESGAMRPRLCQVFRQFSNPLPQPIIQWQHYAGMGDTVLTLAKSDDVAAAERLMAKGYIVPTWEDSSNPYDGFYQLAHFDDLNWARTDGDGLVLYHLRMPLNADYPDDVMYATERPEAVKEFRRRAEYTEFADDAPFHLKGFGIVTPIITDKRQIELRQRQMAQAAGVLKIA